MYNAGTLGVTALTAQEAIERSDQGGTDVDTHDNGIYAGEVQCAGNCQRLQHGNGSGGGLHDNSQHQTGQDAQNRLVTQTCQQIQKCGVIGKALHGAGHIHQTDKQDTKADADIANGLGLAALDKHH